MTKLRDISPLLMRSELYYVLLSCGLKYGLRAGEERLFKLFPFSVKFFGVSEELPGSCLPGKYVDLFA